MRTLVYTTGSPFARGVRIVLDELGLDYRGLDVSAGPLPGAELTTCPTLQAPVLTDGDVTLWESGLIAEYLLSKCPDRPHCTAPPLAPAAFRPGEVWHDRLVLASIQTLGAAVTTIGQMKWSGAGHDRYDYLTRHAERVPHLMAWLEERLPDPDQGFLPGVLSLQDIFLTCHLSYVANRPIGIAIDLAACPGIDGLLQRNATRESFVRNPILPWAPT